MKSAVEVASQSASCDSVTALTMFMHVGEAHAHRTGQARNMTFFELDARQEVTSKELLSRRLGSNLANHETMATRWAAAPGQGT